jgi:hypothetical protein
MNNNYTPEELKVLSDKDYDAIGTQLDIDNWAGAFIVGGIMIAILGIMLFIGKCVAYFVSYLV